MPLLGFIKHFCSVISCFPLILPSSLAVFHKGVPSYSVFSTHTICAFNMVEVAGPGMLPSEKRSDADVAAI